MDYSAADLVILEIIGLDSPVLQGLPIPEASGTNQEEVVEPAVVEAAPINVGNASLNGGAQPSVQTCRRQRGRRYVSAEDEDDMEMKKKKLMLQVEGIELDNHKRILELMDFERKLHLEPSQRVQNFMNTIYKDNVL